MGLFVIALCLFGNGVFLSHVAQSYPIDRWLAWHLLQLVGWTLLLNGSFVAAGHSVLRRWLGVRGLAPAELLVSSGMVGLSMFALLMYAGGALSWFHWTFSLGLPLLLWGLGARDLRELWVELTHQRWRSHASSAWARGASFLASAFGMVMLALLYLESLTPESFNFDAIWYHVPIAQDYVREGGIVPFFGDNHRAYPHLTSLLQTWALLVPGLEPLPVRWMLMLHLEYSFVVWRLLGALATMQWLLNGRYIAGLWACFFLFPSVFIYDQNIAGSADHVLGATAAPLFLATGRLLKRFEAKWAILAGVYAGCHILTKYQAVYLVAAVAATVCARVALIGARMLIVRWRSLTPSAGEVSGNALLRGPLLVVAFAAFVSSPHFVKNWVFYDNPLYPFASGLFPSSFEEWTPRKTTVHSLRAEDLNERERSVPPHAVAEPAATIGDGRIAVKPKRTAAVTIARKADSEDQERRASRASSSSDELFRFPSRSYDFKPQGKGVVERAVWLHKILWDWSFKTGNRQLTQHRPYMGSLFTLLLPILLLLRPARRLWFSVAFLYVAFAVWGLTSANDRYLLSFLSVVIGVSGALLVRTWQLGWLGRVGLVPLVAIQLLWSVDAPFTYGQDKLRHAMRLMDRGYDGASEQVRFRYREKQQSLTEEFPKDALILGRYFKDQLGFDRAVLNTHRAIQKYIPLGRLESTRQFWQLAKDRGVTHLLYPPGNRRPHWAQDVVLFDALVESSKNKRTKHGYVIAELSDEPPPDSGPLRVLVLGVREYEDGLYPVKRLSVDERKGRSHVRSPAKRDRYSPERAEILLDRAGAVLMSGSRLRGEAGDTLKRDFERVESFGGRGVYIRIR